MNLKFFAILLIFSCGMLTQDNLESQNNPLIHAVMITGKDRFHFNLAIGSIISFFQQTYPNKKLLIINDGEYSFDFLNPNLVTEIKTPKGKTLGELRNLAIEYLEQDALWIQWDDDDWHDKLCIEKQYIKLKKSGCDAVFLKNQIQYYFGKNLIRRKYAEPIIGTVMAKNKRDVTYPPIKKSEDLYFFRDYQAKYKIFNWDNPPELYLRFVHDHNTWNLNHFGLKKAWQELGINNLFNEEINKVVEFYKYLIQMQ